jgi:hypothetical protein
MEVQPAQQSFRLSKRQLPDKKKISFFNGPEYSHSGPFFK